jgi:hypothetical protein
MTVSLPIAASLPHVAPTPVTVSAESPMPVTYVSVPLDEARWEAWRVKGRLADAAFAEMMRSVALMGVVLAGAAGAFWIGLD